MASHPAVQTFRSPMRRAVALVVALLTASTALVAGGTPSAAAPPPTSSLRIATFNTFLLSPSMRCVPLITDPESVPNVAVDFFDCLRSDVTERRAREIAARLAAHADEYDLLALNEVWDEDARAILLRALRPHFSHVVEKIDLPLVQSKYLPIPDSTDTFKLNVEDSGLMLFARDRLIPAPLPKLGAAGPIYVGSGHDLLPVPPSGLMPLPTIQSTFDQVGFTAFGNACGGDDCLASKGAGIVRFHDPGTDDDVTVVFTHMQADGEHDDVRQQQLDAIKGLVQKSVDVGPHAHEQLHIMGDLNVRGEGRVFPIMTAGEAQGEWWSRFGDTSSWFASTVHDTWALTTSAKDRGITHTTSDERLDYLLSSRVMPGSLGWRPWDVWSEDTRCVQHLTNEHDDLPSDHVMVRADVARPWFFCNPRAAWRNPPEDRVLAWHHSVGRGGDATRIRHPGSMQWLHVENETAAAYEIGWLAGTMPLAIDIYAPEDLSTPIAPYRSEQVSKTVEGEDVEPLHLEGWQYVLPKEFYVRLRADQPGATGDTSPILHRMRCDRPAEACPLDAAMPQEVRFPGTTQQGDPIPHGAEDTAWFRIDVHQQADSGAAQTVRSIVEGIDTSRFEVRLVDEAKPYGPSVAAMVTGDPGVHHQLAVPSPRSLLLRVRRTTHDGTPTLARVQWRTDLQLVEVTELVCFDETNGFAGSEAGHDEINVEVRVDGAMRWLVNSYMRFDCDSSKDLKSLSVTYRFLDDTRMRIWEIDDASPNDSGGLDSLTATGRALAPHEASKTPEPFVWDFAGGAYRLYMELMRRPNEPVL